MSKYDYTIPKIKAEKVKHTVNTGQWFETEENYEKAMLEIEELKESMQEHYSKVMKGES